jgi:hypothetical protein
MSAITLLAAWVAARMPTAAHVAAPEPVQV